MKNKLKCPTCPRIFKGAQGLAAHLRHNHQSAAITPAVAKPNGNALGELLNEVDGRMERLQVIRNTIVDLAGMLERSA